MDRANAIIVCIMFGAWIQKILRTSLKRFGTISLVSGNKYDIAIFGCVIMTDHVP